MSHDISDEFRLSWGRAKRLAVAGRIENHRADESAVVGDAADVLVVDEQDDALPAVFGAETDVIEPAEVANRCTIAAGVIWAREPHTLRL